MPEQDSRPPEDHPMDRSVERIDELMPIPPNGFSRDETSLLVVPRLSVKLVLSIAGFLLIPYALGCTLMLLFTDKYTSLLINVGIVIACLILLPILGSARYVFDPQSTEIVIHRYFLSCIPVY